MKFVFTDKKVDLPGYIHAYAEKKVGKLDRFFKEDATAAITFSVEKDRLNQVEITIRSNGTIFRVSESTSDMHASIDAAVTTLEGIGTPTCLHPLQHSCHLLFCRCSVACYRHFYLARLVFADGYVAHYGCSDSHSLCTSKLQHTLHILAEERCLDSHFVRMIRVDDGCYPFEYLAKTQVVRLILVQLDDAHGYQFSLVALHTQQSVAHHVGARIHSHHYLFGFAVVPHFCFFVAPTRYALPHMMYQTKPLTFLYPISLKNDMYSRT